MKPQVIHISGDQLPAVWRPAWEACWAVVLDGALVAGPFATEAEARVAAESPLAGQ